MLLGSFVVGTRNERRVKKLREMGLVGMLIVEARHGINANGTNGKAKGRRRSRYLPIMETTFFTLLKVAKYRH